MEKRTILAFVLSFLVLVSWAYFFTPQEPAPRQTEAPNDVVGVPPEQIPPLPRDARIPTAPPTEAPASVDEKEVTVETPLYRAVLSNVGPTIKSFQLKEYRENSGPNAPMVDLVTIPGGMGEFLHMGFSHPSAPVEKVRVYEVDKGEITLGANSPPEELVFRSLNAEGIVTTQAFRFHADRYGIDLTIGALNPMDEPFTGTFASGLRAFPPAEKRSYYSYVGLSLLQNNNLEKLEIKKPSEEKVLQGPIGWFAYEDDYFISAVVPDETRGIFEGRLQPSGILEGTYRQPAVTVMPSEQASSHFLLYFGPLELNTLRDFGHGLDRAINFGWTDIIAKPLLFLLQFFNRFTYNYGIAIILLTVLVKIIFWPLTHKSYKSMKEMQKLQPRMVKIREKYKGNKEQMNKEMMSLYKTYKVNPLSGCLPMVIQIPVFFALFRLLGSAIELRHAPFLFWINDLSAPDRLFTFSFGIPFMTAPYGIPVLTLLMGASMFVQQKMTPTVGDPTQAKIMMFLPVIFTFMFINFPSGLVLYWLVNNLLSIGQQYHILKKSA
jgi:YidC/Oxa1 family membrane protein insertase